MPSTDDEMEPRLPPELLSRILSLLDPSRESARAIARFSACSRACHALASRREVWLPHVTARFKRHRSPPKADTDLRRLYGERDRADAEALALLDETIDSPVGRLVRMARCCELGIDVVECIRDVYQAMSALPYDFAWPQRPKDWLARMYWAKEIAFGIERRHAVERWRRAAAHDAEVGFEEGLALFSVWRGGNLARISEELDALAADCRTWLRSNQVDVHAAIPMMRGIHTFMVSEGFVRASHGNEADRQGPRRRSRIPSTRRRLPTPCAAAERPQDVADDARLGLLLHRSTRWPADPRRQLAVHHPRHRHAHERERIAAAVRRVGLGRARRAALHRHFPRGRDHDQVGDVGSASGPTRARS